MAWQSKDCQPKRYNFQLVLCTGGQSGNATASFYFHAIISHPSNGDIHFVPLYTESSAVWLQPFRAWGRGGNAMASVSYKYMSSCTSNGDISPTTTMPETVFHLATNVN